jgi:hypothetical protein
MRCERERRRCKEGLKEDEEERGRCEYKREGV